MSIDHFSQATPSLSRSRFEFAEYKAALTVNPVTGFVLPLTLSLAPGFATPCGYALFRAAQFLYEVAAMTLAAGTSSACAGEIPNPIADNIANNERTSEDTSFFAVKINVVRIGDSTPAPNFEIVSQPNEWAKQVLDDAADWPHQFDWYIKSGELARAALDSIGGIPQIDISSESLQALNP